MSNLECSSRGDTRFSAFYARVDVNGRMDSIENHYQLCKRFGDYTPQTWKYAKGKKPTHISVNNRDYDVKHLTAFYKLLWCSYLDHHPELAEVADKYDTFTDMFKGKSTNCQADVIRQYVKHGRDEILKECDEFIKLLREV